MLCYQAHTEDQGMEDLGWGCRWMGLGSGEDIISSVTLNENPTDTSKKQINICTILKQTVTS